MLALSLSHYLAVSAVLFALGAFGIFLNRKNVIKSTPPSPGKLECGGDLSPS